MLHSARARRPELPTPGAVPVKTGAAPPIGCLTLCLALAACSIDPTSPPGRAPDAVPAAGSAAGSLLFSSPECLAKGLKPGDPFPSSAIPAAALANRTSGSVAIRYDVIDGVAQNLQIVASNPAGVYDDAALRHAAKYRDPTRSTVRGCVMTIDIRF